MSQTWRFFATGFCFSVFGIGGILMALLWLPLYRITHKDEDSRKKACRYAVYLAFRGFVRLMYLVGVTTVNTNGIEKLKAAKGKIIIANHPSLIDVVVLISLIRNAECVVKQDLKEKVFTRGVLRNTGYISNADPDGLIKDCKASLEKGSNLIIFPEGTRTKPNSAIKFQRGAANIALRCGINFQRVLIHVSPPALTKGLPWYKIPKRRIHMELTVLEEIDVSQYDKNMIGISARHLTRDIERLYTQDLAKIESV